MGRKERVGKIEKQIAQALFVTCSAKKIKKKGRAKGGMLIGVRKKEFGEGSKLTEEEKEECICTTLKRKENQTKYTQYIIQETQKMG